ncbi:MAG: ribbon-helix-helix protein, CopG family [Gaiellaceae bacterium]
MSRKRQPTSGGVPATDELIDKLSTEAERGYDPIALCGRPRLGAGPSEIVPVRLNPQLRHALQQRADEEHTTQSDLIRRALRRYLHVA